MVKRKTKKIKCLRIPKKVWNKLKEDKDFMKKVNKKRSKYGFCEVWIMAKKKDNTIWWVIGVIAVLVIVVGGGIGLFSNKCSGEFEQISMGVGQNYNQKCCSGLTQKAPEGFMGGAWCVRPYCDVVCLTGDEETQGVSMEGIYSVCHSQTDTSVRLLQQISCPRF